MTDLDLDEDGGNGCAGGKKEDCTKSIDHKGQGDGPCTIVEDAALSN